MNNYRNIGLKLTPQRMEIFDYLDGNRDHPSAEEIFKAVSKKFPTMSFATVYNTLGALKKKGVIRELTIDPGKKRYDPNAGSHNHLICLACKKVVDIETHYAPRLPKSMRKDFTVFSNQIEFYGVCSRCKDNNDEEQRPAKEDTHVHGA